MRSKGEYPRQSGDSSQEQAREYSRVQPSDESGLLPTRGKTTLWQKVKNALILHLKHGRHLAEAYAEATVQKEYSEAHKIAEEAAEIAARKDLIKQEEVKEFASIVDNIFAADGLPQTAKALKLAKLMQNNPQVAVQLANAKEIFERLCPERLTDASDKCLPTNPRESKQQG